MIRTLHLTNWRAYESLRLDLDAGTTFVVARNGLGKSSLLEGARFAATGVIDDAKHAVRAGRKQATGEVVLELPDGSLATVTRTLAVGARGKAEVSVVAAIEGRPVDDIDALLERAWGAPLSFVAQTAFLQEGLQRAARVGIRDQLARAFGVDELRRSLSQLHKALEALGTETVALDRQVRTASGHRDEKAAELEQLEEALTQAEERVTEARQALDEAEAARKAAAVFETEQARHRAWLASRMALTNEIATFIGSEVSLSSVTSALGREESTVSASLTATRGRAAVLRSRVDALTTAIDELSRAGASCPVCRQPLSDKARREAQAGHEAELAELAGELAGLDDSALAQRAGELRQLSDRLTALGPEPAPPDPIPAIDVDLAWLRADWEAAMRQAVESRAERDRVAGELSALDAEAARQDRVRLAYREVALLDAARVTTDGVIERILDERVDPALGLVRTRWKRLFPDRPDLRLDVEGNFTREIAGATLPFEAFSAGERAAAELLLRLVLVDVATRVRACWIDEPLEHLDPTARRHVAGLLARASARGDSGTLSLAQLLVTTYEEPLARRLADAVEGTRIVYVAAQSAE